MTDIEAYEAGTAAFHADEMRIVPRDILVNAGCGVARSWYLGWDTANALAPVPEMEGCNA